MLSGKTRNIFEIKTFRKFNLDFRSVFEKPKPTFLDVFTNSPPPIYSTQPIFPTPHLRTAPHLTLLPLPPAARTVSGVCCSAPARGRPNGGLSLPSGPLLSAPAVAGGPRRCSFDWASSCLRPVPYTGPFSSSVLSLAVRATILRHNRPVCRFSSCAGCCEDNDVCQTHWVGIMCVSEWSKETSPSFSFYNLIYIYYFLIVLQEDIWFPIPQ